MEMILREKGENEGLGYRVYNGVFDFYCVLFFMLS